MKYKWLNKNQNKSLIMFFNGWGMDEAVVNHLNPEHFDVVMFYDYTTLETDFLSKYILSEYSDINVIAWSMGVIVSEYIINKYRLTLSHLTVLNGTLRPIDLKFGINPKVYDLTLREFSKDVRNQFVENMFENCIPEQLKLLSRDVDNQREELQSIKNFVMKHKIEDYFPSKIIISENDKIFPSKCQSRFWNVEPNLKGGHCQFFSFSNWGELL